MHRLALKKSDGCFFLVPNDKAPQFTIQCRILKIHCFLENVSSLHFCNIVQFLKCLVVCNTFGRILLCFWSIFHLFIFWRAFSIRNLETNNTSIYKRYTCEVSSNILFFFNLLLITYTVFFNYRQQFVQNLIHICMLQ